MNENPELGSTDTLRDYARDTPGMSTGFFRTVSSSWRRRRLQVPCVAARGGSCGGTGVRSLMKHHDLRGQLFGEGLAEGRRIYYRDVYVRSVSPHRRAAPIPTRQHLVHTAYILRQLGLVASLAIIASGTRNSRHASLRGLVAARPTPRGSDLQISDSVQRGLS